MGKYAVLQPVAYMHDGKAVHQTHREIDTVVEVDDDVAAPLVDAGKLEPLGITGPTKTVLDNIKRTEKTLEGDIGGPVLDQAEDESPDSDDTDTERTPRRRGRRSED